jgi:dihydrofolate reductase
VRRSASSVRNLAFTGRDPGAFEEIDRAQEHRPSSPRPPGEPGAGLPLMPVSVFVGTSVDGFIARLDGGLDFLDAGGAEPHGYEEFIAGIDAIVMGRKTFETVLGFGGPWPFGRRRVVVLSGGSLDLSGVQGEAVEQMAGEPAEIVSRRAAQGAHNLYVDGGVTVQGFLRAGVVTRLIVTRVPVLIGEGIPLFGTVPRDILLRHVTTRSFRGGLVQSEYEVVAARP